MDWNDFVHLAFDEIRLAGSGSPQVSRRMTAALLDLIEVAPEERRAALREHLELLHAAISAGSRADADKAYATEPDTQGIGVRRR